MVKDRLPGSGILSLGMIASTRECLHQLKRHRIVSYYIGVVMMIMKEGLVEDCA